MFVAVFLIAAIAVVGTMVALTSTSQQRSSARSLNATGAFYAARARLDREIQTVATTSGHGNSCPATGSGSDADIDDFTTRLMDCTRTEVDEGGDQYEVYFLQVAAFRGRRNAATLVRRELEAVVTNID